MWLLESYVVLARCNRRGVALLFLTNFNFTSSEESRVHTFPAGWTKRGFEESHPCTSCLELRVTSASGKCSNHSVIVPPFTIMLCRKGFILQWFVIFIQSTICCCTFHPNKFVYQWSYCSWRTETNLRFGWLNLGVFLINWLRMATG